MSLDVYLIGRHTDKAERQAIFIREGGQRVEISREEWDQRYPDQEPMTCEVGGEGDEVFEANVTHNLNQMASEAGIYEHLWQPETVGVEKAAELIEPLEKGLAKLKENPGFFKTFNPPNGWGSYEMFVPWVERYLQACRENPDAIVRVSR